MRAFIAFKLPGLITTDIQAIQEKLAGYRFKVRWVKADNIHLTLKFLGDVDVHIIEAVSACVAEAVNGMRPFQLAASGIGVFPNIKRARVVWIGLSEQVKALNELQKSIDINLAELGFSRERRQFKGHLTLGRSKGTIDAANLAEALEEFRTFKSKTFIVDRVTVFRSDLKSSGAVYTELREIALASDQMHYW
jgi:2'-5' RNA ligase